MPTFNNPYDALKYHVSGKIARGEAVAITEVRGKPQLTWVVGDNIPGYMPDSEPFGAEDWQHGRASILGNR